MEPGKNSPPTLPHATPIGFTMILLAIAVIVSSNYLSFDAAGLSLALGFFLFLGGLGVLMMGLVQTQSRKSTAEGAQAQPQVIREIVKVRCSHCNALNFETSNRCTNCGANL